jgi:hypothetical protein
MEKLQNTEKPDDETEKGVSSYLKLKVEALDRRLWRTGFARSCGPVVRQADIRFTTILKDIRLTTILILIVFW